MNSIIWSSGHTLKINNIVKADNCRIWDSNGKEYVDLESGVWCTCLGHSNKRINSAIADQISKITHSGFCWCNPLISEAAVRVLEITGLAHGKCEFLSAGSEAVEYGMRIARKLSTKPLALTLAESYFGAYGDAAAKSASSWYLFDRLNCGCQSEDGCQGTCADFNNIPFDQIGIFLFEPGSSSGLVRFPSNGLIAAIASRVKESGGIVMANEITTGIGRTGKWFGYQHYNLQPDIVVIGKGIGNGYPVSVAAISEQIISQLEPTQFLYAQSHQNDPLGARVALEVIDAIKEDNLVERANEMGSYLISELNLLRQKHPLIKAARGRGMMMVIEFTGQSMQVYEALLSKGFILAKRANAEVLRLDPALTIAKEQIDNFVKVLDEILQKDFD